MLVPQKSKLLLCLTCLGLVVIFVFKYGAGGYTLPRVNISKLKTESLQTQMSTNDDYTHEDLLRCQEVRLKRLKDQCAKKELNSSLSGLSLASLRQKTQLFIVDNPHQVILRAIPKTGISSWKTIFINNSVNRIDKNGVIKQWDWGLIRGKYGLKVLANERDVTSMVSKLTNYFNILTVRHPFDRLESGFWDRSWRGMKTKNTSDLAKAAETYGQFLKTLERRIGDGHFKPVYGSTDPCTIPFSFITKLETANMEMDYIIQHKLSGRGQSLRKNAYNKRSKSQTATMTVGKVVPLLSRLPDPQRLVDRIMSIYRQDMELFGYTYKIQGGKVIALCEQYDHHNVCC